MAAQTAGTRFPRGPLAIVTMLLCCIAVLFTAPVADFYIQQAFVLFFFAALAQSWNILGGYSGYLSLGHAAFVGVGGYTVASLYFLLGLSPFLTFPLAGVTAAIFALIIGAICFRIRGSYFLIATMLVLFIMQSLALNLRPVTNGSNGIDLPLFTENFELEGDIWYFCGLALAVITSGTAYLIEHSRFGLNLVAIREDEDVARAMGVRVVHCKAAAFVISAALAGVSGAFYTYRAHIIEPFYGLQPRSPGGADPHGDYGRQPQMDWSDCWRDDLRHHFEHPDPVGRQRVQLAVPCALPYSCQPRLPQGLVGLAAKWRDRREGVPSVEPAAEALRK